MKGIRLIIIMIAVLLMIPPASSGAVADNAPFQLKSESALLMDAESGQVLYSKNGDEALPPASVTKVMTLLCIFEAMENGAFSLSDKISVSPNAASMGGSQVYLEPGEEMTVDDLLKCVVVSSANDAAVALAEKVAGSEEAFVLQMNRRAGELCMKNSSFENVTGLDDTASKHYMSAYDIALASRELITKHKKIFDYTTIWTDTVRNGEFGLSNTNRLIRFYKGATGLKTGSTSKAGFCISATAERNGMHLIAVIMGSKTRDERNTAATMLLDWGFSTYLTYEVEGGSAGEIKIIGGERESARVSYPKFKTLLGRGKEKKMTVKTELQEEISAPAEKGDQVGRIQYLCDGVVVGEVPVCLDEDVPKIGFFGILAEFLRCCFAI